MVVEFLNRGCQHCAHFGLNILLIEDHVFLLKS